MENNNNGRGIFYGVIGVATLVVAIIGATFAYFSAQVGANDAINVSSTTVELRMTGITANLKKNMIPVETDDSSEWVDIDHDNNTGTAAIKTSAFARYPGIGDDDCIDDNGNSICGVYTFTIENPNTTTAQSVIGSITFSGNTGFTNMKYAVFKGKASDITFYDVNGTLTSTTAEGAGNGTLVAKGTVPAKGATEGLTQEWANTEELLAKSGKTSYTVVVWLEDTGEAQDAEQGQTFSASILFRSPDGAGVTGALSAG